jgi:response regulator RpfG family c-di-GMP phosphodiesterase
VNILLTDDDTGCLKVLERFLKECGYECYSYSNPVEAVKAIKTKPFDVVITDILMPQMNGIDVLKSVKETNSETKVIMLTGYASIENTEAALNQGAYSFFRKPLDLNIINETLQKIEKELSVEREIRSKIHKFEATKEELNLTYQDLQHHVVVVDQLHAISQKIHANDELYDIMRELLAGASHLLDCEHCLISFQEKKLRRCGCFFGNETVQSGLCENGDCILNNSAFESCYKDKKCVLDSTPSLEIIRTIKSFGIDLYNYVSVPLIHKDKVLGVMAGLNKKAGFSSRDKFLLNALSGTAVTAIQYSGLINQLKELFEQTVEALAKGIDARDAYTLGHSSRVSYYTKAIGYKLGWNKTKLDEAYLATLLHDIGKIGIPDIVLNKPGRLSEQEYLLMKDHVMIGIEILKDIPKLRNVLNYIHYHHERFDGKGYPTGLGGEEIPVEGRVVCVADSFDAMTSNRGYRKALSLDMALAELENCKGSQFDPKIVEVFESLIRSGDIENTLDKSGKLEQAAACIDF